MVRRTTRTLMTLLLGLFMLGFVVGANACAKTPPNITPEAVVAFHGAQVTHYLDRVRDAANDAHHTTPPLLDAVITLKIVDWHQGAIVVVHEAKKGWQAVVIKSLDVLSADLSPHDREVVAPYFAAAKLVINEVVQ